MSLEDSPHVEKRAASVDSTHLLPESTFALVLPVAIVVIFGVESLIGAVPLAVVLYVAAGVPWRVKVGGGLVTLDYLPFGLMRRVFPARSVSGELEYQYVVIDLPRRVLWRESFRVVRLRPGAARMVEALRTEGSSIYPAA